MIKVALGLLGVGWLGGNWLIRRGLKAPRIADGETPSGSAWQPVAFSTANRKILRGWWIPAGEQAPALAVIHGWGGNAAVMLPLVDALHRAGYALLLFSARNHGASDDDTFSSLPRFAEDLEHAVDWLRARPEVDARRIGLLGHSVGAGAALLVAARRHDVAAVVSLSAFAHPAGMMRRWLRWKGIPYRPFGWYVLAYVQHVIGHRFDDIAPLRTIADVACPVLLVHGTEDDIVPVNDAHEILAAARPGQARLLLIPGKHDDFTDIDGPLAEVVDFLDKSFWAAG